ncbi:GreA/GreB family elongation factor [Sphingomonas sp. 1P06PA]|uniref:GreA/GreB family elongation factor n=1 Tax=Sphingomonas sp. 1P06PA TaxID=554121 RepID=UPI0039A4D2C7
MSVAFRRESDEEHLEPRPDLPIPPGPNLVTPRGLTLIETRAAEFEAALEKALEEKAGDDAVKAIRRDLRYWHARRATAQLAPAADGEDVAFGTRVTYRRGKADHSITLVGDDEADPAAGLIAFTAPLARALMGAVEGDKVAFGADTLTVRKIEPIKR